MTEFDYDLLRQFHLLITAELQKRDLPLDTPIVVHENGWHTAVFKEFCVICKEINGT